MKRWEGVALGTFAAAVAAGQGLEVAAPRFEFGERYQFEEVEHVFLLRNPGPTEQRLAAEPLSAAATVTLAPEMVPAGGEATLTVRQPLGNTLGETAFRVRLRTATGEERKLTLSGFVQSAYDPERVFVDFGRVVQTDGASAEVVAGSREIDGLAALGLAEEAPAWLAFDPLPAGPRTARRPLGRLRLLPGAPAGIWEGKVRLRTNLPVQPLLEVSCRAEVFGDIVPGRAWLDFGLVRVGERTEMTVDLLSRSRRPFGVERVEGTPAGVEAFAVPCAGAPGGATPADCQRLVVRVRATETGLLKAVLRVVVTGEAEPVPVGFGALAAAAGTEVKQIPSAATGELPADLLTALGGPPSAGTPAASAQAAAPRTPEAPASTPQPSPVRRVTLTWKAAKEEGIYGYLVYRAEARVGPFRRLHREIVRVEEGGEPQHVYRYEDRTVEAGKTYFYYVDLVAKSGRKQGLSPVLERAIAADAAP